MTRKTDGQVRVDAVYEGGVLRPLRPLGLEEGQRVSLTIEEGAIKTESPEEALRAWQEVFAGLTEEDIAEIEAIALDRSDFMRQEPGEE